MAKSHQLQTAVDAIPVTAGMLDTPLPVVTFCEANLKPRALYVHTAGTIVGVVAANEQERTIENLAVGQFNVQFVQPNRGTTAVVTALY